MVVSYDEFTAAFLAKITEYDFVKMNDGDREAAVDGYMKRACAVFSEVCRYDICNGDDNARAFDLRNSAGECSPGEAEEIVDIVSDGMVLQWFKQYFAAAENMRNMINSTDFYTYSPAELMYRMTNAYKLLKRDYIVRVREYSYRHGTLTDLYT